jgi:8-oxo-dGTP pyrophosphatase MutT (NUDIX family)
MWHPSDRLFTHLAAEQLEPFTDVTDTPHTCSYCGAQEFDPVEDTGRGLRAVCSACGGAMLRTEDGQWTPAGLNSTHNHPKPDGDPGSGGVGGAANVGVDPDRMNDASARHGLKIEALNDEVPWCAHLYHGNCTYPGDKLPNGTILGIPQDRGPCPWKHNAFQQAACPISEPGPTAVMRVNAALHEGMPSRKHPAPDDLYYDTHDPRPGTQHFDEAEEKNPGWSHHVLRAHRTSVDGGGSQPHMVGSIYYSHQSSGPVPMVKVHKMLVGAQHRSQGIASAMQDELHRQYPGHFIDHGDRTADGHGWAAQYEVPPDHIMSQMHASLSKEAISWDDIGDRHPHIYGDSEIHGEAADGADGPGIGDAANYLAHERPEDPDAERHSVHDLDFHEEHVDPRHIDYSPSGRDDYRVSHAMEGYREHPDKMPPLVLVKRHNVYQVADGHHRAEAADAVGSPVRAYVAHSPYPDEPFRDGDKGPFHRAEPIDASTRHEASWADVRNKAKRIRREGGVNIIVASTDGVAGEVQGDTHVYETAITWVPGTSRTAAWTCGCKWGAYAWGPTWDGRPCAHVLAMRFEAQSRSAHGREIEVDQKRPDWLKPQTSVVVQYERPSEKHPQGRDLTRRAVPPGNMRTEWHGRSRTRRSSLHSPEEINDIVAQAFAEAKARLDRDDDSADVIDHLITAGLPHDDAQNIVLAARGRTTLRKVAKRCPECGAELESTAGQCSDCGAVLPDRTVTHKASWGDDEQRCPHCHGYLGPVAFKAGKCPHCGHGLAHKTASSEVDYRPHRTQDARSDAPIFGKGVDDWGLTLVDCPQCGGKSGCGHCGGSGQVISTGGTTGNPTPDQNPAAGDAIREDGISDTSALHPQFAAKEKAGPSVAGVALKAADTGRILMLQRGLEDEKDPARGTWEIPGGHVESGDRHTLDTAVREWCEEVGQPFPEGGVVTHAWTSPNGIYQGHVVVIPRERDLVMHDGRVIPNPDDPHGDKAEQAAWWEVDHARKNPALRPELKNGTPWNKIKDAGTEAGLMVESLLRQGAAWDSLYSLEESQPVTPPAHSESENPISTGFLTTQDPASWSEVTHKPHHLMPADSLDSPTATFHSVPEGALPFTDGADDLEDSTSGTGDQYGTQTNDDDTQSLDGDTDGIPDTEQEGSPMEPLGGMASKRSVADIVEQFQRTAGAQMLQSGSEGGSDVGFSDGEIAAKAKERLAAMSKTALKNFTFSEQQELITEGMGSRARNFGDLNVAGTHYEALNEALSAADLNDDDILIL